MKPGFALSLSVDGISLLHRAAGGWRSVGTVGLDSPDLGADLNSLRQRALRLDPDGIRCKVIIPNEQVRYLTIDAGSEAADSRRQEAERALDGATPYRLDDLAYDISPDGPSTHVAAVARQTLSEAESFARDHGFDPVSFVAVPGDNPFLGEPFFGVAAEAEALTGSNAVEPDGVSVVVIGPAEIPDAAPPRTAKSDPQVGFASRRGKDAPSAPRLSGASRTVPPAPGKTPASAPPEPIPEPPAAPEARPTPPAGLAEIPARPDPEPAASLSRDAPEFAAAPPDPRPADPEPVLAVSTPVPGTATQTAPEIERMTIFGARQSARVGGKPRHLGLILTMILLLVLALVALWATLFLDNGLAGLFRSPPATEIVAKPEPATETGAAVQTDAAAPKPAAPAAPDVASGDLIEPQAAPDTGGEAPVAAGDPEPSAPEIAQPAALAALPEPETVPEIDASQRLSETDSAVLDALRTAPETVEELDYEPEPSTPETLYAATGIWQTAPDDPVTPGIVPLDDLYLASIDRTDLSQDAIALPPAGGYDTDFSPAALASPAAPETAFQLDRRGLVDPTPEGTLNPDGVMVYLGRPAVVPPPTPERTAAAAETDAADERLAGLRPRARPNNLVEQAERSQLGGRSREELAGVRPRMRPETAQAREEPADPAPTAQAVVVTLRPKLRPEDLRIVSAPAPAQNLGSLANPDSGGTVFETDTFAAAAVTPRSASPASVARNATLRNSINLRQTNLIGVYGTPANRRALVRLPSGRYKKVKVGDTMDGGRVVAIGDSELRYQKGGRNVTLRIPSG